MSKTGYNTLSPEAKKLWEAMLFKDILKESFFNRFYSKDGSNVVYVKTDLEKSFGDRIRFALRARLTGDPIIDKGTLENNEQNLSTYTFDLDLHQYRGGVRDDGEFSRQIAMFDINQESERAIRDWGTELIDKLAFDAAFAAFSKIFYAGTATSTANLTSSDKLTPALISKVKTWALTGGNRTQVPIKPIKIGGQSYFVLLCSWDQAYDLKTDTTVLSNWRDALPRSSDNPIFTGMVDGAVLVHDGVIIFAHENTPSYTNWGAASNVAGSKAIFMGQSALALGWGKQMKVVKELFDYENEVGYGVSMIQGIEKPSFNSQDYGSVGVFTARTNISG